MDRVTVSTVVYTDPQSVYDFLVDFERYGDYTDYVKRVMASGDGGPGTRYAIEFGWWKLTYTARSRVVDLDPPREIEWRITKDIDANGRWLAESVPLPADAPEWAEVATKVTVDVEYDPGSVGPSALDLPRLVSLDWVLDKVKPRIAEAATQVLRRIVTDLEGQPRDPDLTVHRTPDDVDLDADDLQVTDDDRGTAGR
jgi:SH3-like domain-containing protein